MSKLVIKGEDAKKIGEHGISVFSEYNLPFKDISVGVSEITGRYPQIGFDVDEEVEQVWYIESGNGIVYLEGSEYPIKSGDMVLVPKGERYWIEGNFLKIVTSSTPPWYKEQHKHLDV